MSRSGADYFPHQRGFRDRAECKAMRRRTGLRGYGFLLMLKERLIEEEEFSLPTDEETISLLGEDFDLEESELRELLSKALESRAIRIEGGMLSMPSLDEDLAPLLRYRRVERGLAREEQEENVIEFTTGKREPRTPFERVVQLYARLHEKHYHTTPMVSFKQAGQQFKELSRVHPEETIAAVVELAATDKWIRENNAFELTTVLAPKVFNRLLRKLSRDDTRSGGSGWGDVADPFRNRAVGHE